MNKEFLGRMIHFIRCSLYVAGNGLRRTARSVNFYTVVFFVFLFWYLFLWNIKGLAQDCGYGVPPYLIPHFFASSLYGNYGMFMMVLLTCTAPFVGENILYSISRCGRRAWATGKMIYIVAINIIFQAVMLAAEIIVLLPHFAFSGEWGSVLRTAAANPDSLTRYNGYGSINRDIINSMTPIEAVTKQLLLCVFLGSVIGVLTFLINGLTRRAIGSVILVGAILATDYVKNLEFLFGDRFDSSMSIFRWMDLKSYLDGSYEFCTNLMWLGGIFLAGAVLSEIAVKYGWIRLTE